MDYLCQYMTQVLYQQMYLQIYIHIYARFRFGTSRYRAVNNPRSQKAFFPLDNIFPSAATRKRAICLPKDERWIGNSSSGVMMRLDG